jgi:hypothetical protein
MHSLTLVVVVNVVLFIFVAGAAGLVAWFGWLVAGPDADRGNGGPSVVRSSAPVPPTLPAPAPHWQPADPDDLADSS